MDSSTDKANMDNELILVIWCDTNGTDEKVHSKMTFLCVAHPTAATAMGLFNCLQEALLSIEIQGITASECTKLVGVGTDGASANVAAGGLKGLVEEELPWVYWMWCLAHRLELAVHDALKDTAFSLIDDMLLRLYYLYEKSPKKCRELDDIIQDLHEFIQFDSSGVRPVRSSGSRWISHKLSAMKRVLSKFGAYTNHLATLSQDSSVRPCDRAKLKGYYNKWIDAKYLLGCALFIDLLTPCAILSKAMQKDEIDILGELSGLLKTVKEVNKLKTKCLSSWPTYSGTLKKIEEKDDETTYQLQSLKNYRGAKNFYSRNHQAYCVSINDCLKSRLDWSDLDLIRDIIFVLETQGWQKVLDEEENHSIEKPDPTEAVDRIAMKFEKPLEAAGVEICELRQEFRDMLEHSVQFISLSTLGYQEVWWRLFHSPCAEQWSNILTLAELLFSLPASNGKLERCFSTLKLIKADRRCSLSNDTLDDLLILNTDRVPLQDFNPGAAIDLWWKSKTRRLNQPPRKQYAKHQDAAKNSREIETDHESEDEAGESVLLNDWDEWLNTSDDDLSDPPSSSSDH